MLFSDQLCSECAETLAAIILTGETSLMSEATVHNWASVERTLILDEDEQEHS